ncbi:hypothetical protein EGW08_011728 [Elysia chlorotica]|uniref:EF-hand domain-containing protein n=1 Tax=Elysia chlorotica TaxID=188477 RepID=A0A3S1BC14_ELYCH|nr:hypothetical protein EGW08_011728 [Elysia chlorotica]
MATFDELRKRTKQMSERVAKATDVDEGTVMNVIMYAKNLTPAHRTDVIDKIVFISQLVTRFGMTSMFLIDLIFESVKVKGCSYTKLEDYVRMICVYLTRNVSVKVDYVFKVYDIQRDGYLDIKEIHTLLMSSVIFAYEDQESDDQIKELIDLVMASTDKNNDGIITLDEFRDYVNKDIMCLELLGPVLPLDHIIIS